MPEYMRTSQVEFIVFPVDPRAEAKMAIKELQQQSVINGTSNMTMEEIDAEISLCRKEREKNVRLFYFNSCGIFSKIII